MLYEPIVLEFSCFSTVNLFGVFAVSTLKASDVSVLVLVLS